MSNPLKLSVSKCKVFSSCRKKYEFNYVIKLPKVDRDYHIFGKCLHKALEDFHQMYINGWLLGSSEAMKIAWKTAKTEYASRMTSEAIKECFDILSGYLKLVSEKPKSFLTGVVSAEQAFDFPLADNVILNGFIDKVQIEDDGVLLISDYKSTKNKKYLQDDWFQLQTYAFVIMSQRPELKKVRAAYTMLRHNFENITKEITREEAMAVKDQYLAYAADINSATEYPATTSALCRMCDFIDHCKEGQAAVYGPQQYGEIKWS